MTEIRRSGAADLIIAADFGTSGVKVGLVDGDFRIVAKTSETYPLSLPAPNCAEQAPEDLWAALARCVRRLAGEVSDLGNRAAGLVFCAQMCGLICADADGTPLRPAMIWLDKRSAAITKQLVGGFPEFSGYQLPRFIRWLMVANGAPSQTGMDPTGKMLWVRQHEPDIYQRSAKLLDIKDWLIHRATGVFSTTADSANLTWLMDTRRGREGWSKELSDRVGVPLAKLPDIVDGTSIVGELTQRAASDLGLPKGLPVAGGGGDVSATAIGSGAVADGELHICASTSSWVSGFFNRRIVDLAAFATVTSSLAFRPLLIATQETAGSAFAWASRIVDPQGEDDNDGLAALYNDPGPLADDDPFFLPWLAGERVPVDDHRVRGAFYGLSLRHDRDAMLRAVTEGVVLNTRWVYEKVAAKKGVKLDGAIPLVGGVAQNPVFAQMLADALNRPVVVGDPQHSGVIGAAAIAAAALKWRGSVWDAAGAISARRTAAYEPSPQRVEQIAERYRRLDAIRPALIRLYKRDKGAARP